MREILVLFFILIVLIETAHLSLFNHDDNRTITLKRANSPYLFTNDLVVPPNATLIIEPGVELKFEPMVDFLVQGTLIAAGDETDRIKLTSSRNTSTLSSTSSDFQSPQSASGKLRFANNQGSSRIVEYNNGYKWARVCVTGNDNDQLKFEIFARAVCIDFGFRNSRYSTYLFEPSSSIEVNVLLGCNLMQTESNDISNICDILPLQSAYPWWIMYKCFLIECREPFSNHWGGLIFSNQQSDDTMVSHVDIINAGISKHGNFSVSLKSKRFKSINNLSVINSALNGFNLQNVNSFSMNAFRFIDIPLSAVFISGLNQAFLGDNISLNIENSTFENSHVGLYFQYVYGQVGIRSCQFKFNQFGVLTSLIGTSYFWDISGLKRLDIVIDSSDFDSNSNDVFIPYQGEFYNQVNVEVDKCNFINNTNVSISSEVIGLLRLSNSNFIGCAKTIIVRDKITSARNYYFGNFDMNQVILSKNRFMNSRDETISIEQIPPDNLYISFAKNFSLLIEENFFSELNSRVVNFNHIIAYPSSYNSYIFVKLFNKISILGNIFEKNNAIDIIRVSFLENQMLSDDFLQIKNNSFVGNKQDKLSRFYPLNRFKSVNAVVNIKLAKSFENPRESIQIEWNKFGDREFMYEVAIEFTGHFFPEQTFDLSYNSWNQTDVFQIYSCVYDFHVDYLQPIITIDSYYVNGLETLYLLENNNSTFRLDELNGNFYGQIYGKLELKSGFYTARENIIVKRSGHLIISPQVTILFAPNTSLIVEGMLEAVASLDKPIKLTAYERFYAEFLNLDNSVRLSANSTIKENLIQSVKGTLELQLNRRWYPTCGDNLNEEDLNSMCKLMGFEKFNSLTLVQNSSMETYINQLNCSNEAVSLADCDVNLCADKSICSCSNQALINCSSYEMSWNGVLLTQYAQSSKLSNILIKDYSNNQAGLSIEYMDHQIENLIFDTQIESSTAMEVKNLNPLKTLSINNVTAVTSSTLLQLFQQSSSLMLSNFEGNNVYLKSTNQQRVSLYDLAEYDQNDLCSGRINFQASDTVTVNFDGSPVDCTFNISDPRFPNRSILIAETYRVQTSCLTPDILSVEQLNSPQHKSSLELSRKFVFVSTRTQHPTFRIFKSTSCLTFIMLRFQLTDADSLPTDNTVLFENFTLRGDQFSINSESNVSYIMQNLNVNNLDGIYIQGQLLEMSISNSKVNSQNRGIKLMGTFSRISVTRTNFSTQSASYSSAIYHDLFYSISLLSNSYSRTFEAQAYLDLIDRQINESDFLIKIKSISIDSCRFDNIPKIAIQFEYDLTITYSQLFVYPDYYDVLKSVLKILNKMQVQVKIAGNFFSKNAIAILLNELSMSTFADVSFELPNSYSVSIKVSANEFVDCYSVLRDETTHMSVNQWQISRNLIVDFDKITFGTSQELIYLNGYGSFESNTLENITQLNTNVPSLIYFRTGRTFTILGNTFSQIITNSKYIVSILASSLSSGFNFSMNTLTNNQITNTQSNIRNSIVKFEAFNGLFSMVNNTFDNNQLTGVVEVFGFILADRYELTDIVDYELNELTVDLSWNNWGNGGLSTSDLIYILSKTFYFRLNVNVLPYYGLLNVSQPAPSEYVIKEHVFWRIESSPVYLTENVIILENASLTIEPGVNIYTLKNITFYSFGPLILDGTMDATISLIVYDNYYLNALSSLIYFCNFKNSSVIRNVLFTSLTFYSTLYAQTPKSSIYVEDGISPLIENVKFTFCLVNCITVAKSKTKIELKSVGFGDYGGYSFYLFDLKADVQLSNVQELSSDIYYKSLLIDDFKYEQSDQFTGFYGTYSMRSLNCEQKIFLSKAYEEFVYSDVKPWLTPDCRINFVSTSEKFVLFITVFKQSNNFNNFLVVDSQTGESVQPIRYSDGRLYYITNGPTAHLKIRCLPLNNLCAIRNFYWKIKLVEKFFQPSARRFVLNDNSTGWSYSDYSETVLQLNYSSSRVSEAFVIETEHLNVSICGIYLNTVSYSSFHFTFNLKLINLADNSSRLLWTYVVSDYATNKQLVIDLIENSVPLVYKLQLEVYSNYVNVKHNVTVLNFILLPCTQDGPVQNTSMELEDCRLGSFRIRSFQSYSHQIDIQITRSSLNNFYFDMMSSIVASLSIQDGFFTSSNYYNYFNLNLLQNGLKYQKPTNVTLRNNIFLNTYSLINLEDKNDNSLLNVNLLSNSFVVSNYLTIILNNVYYQIDGNLYFNLSIRNNYLLNILNSRGTATNNIFKKIHNIYFSLIALENSDVLLRNNSFIENDVTILITINGNRLLNIDLNDNWWGTTDKKAIISSISYNDFSELTVLNSSARFELYGACDEGWIESDAQCVRLFHIALSYSSAKQVCDALNSNIADYVSPYVLNSPNLTNSTYWLDLTYMNITCSHFEFDSNSSKFLVKNESVCDDSVKRFFVCDKAYCQALNGCNKRGRCVTLNGRDNCSCFDYSYGAACENFYCEANCSDHGLCKGPNECECDANWSDSTTTSQNRVRYCSQSNCFNVNSCNGHGNCIDVDACECDSGYTGKSCQNWTCTQECLNGAVCNGPNYCQCAPGWQGYSCENYYCDKSCYERGICIGVNKCICNSGYQMDQCEGFNCIGVANCTNNGNCVNANTCLCNSNWFGAFCNETNLLCSNNKDCSYNGDCVNGMCKCYDGWTSDNCLAFTCSGKCENSGVCVGPNKCSCNSNWTGEFCNLPNCPGNCLSRGICIRPNECQCDSRYSGDDCSKCANNTWSSSCNPCPACVNGKCDPQSGICSCDSANWSGRLCDTCSEGFFGSACERLASVYAALPVNILVNSTGFIRVKGYNLLNHPKYNCNFYSDAISLIISATIVDDLSLTCQITDQLFSNFPLGQLRLQISFIDVANTSVQLYDDLLVIYKNCPDDACGERDSIQRGFCTYGACSCLLPFEGDDCEIKIDEPKFLPLQSVYEVKEFDDFGLNVQFESGTQPIDLRLIEYPPGLVLVNSSFLYWKSVSSSVESNKVSIVAKNKAARVTSQFIIKIRPSYSIRLANYATTSDYVLPSNILINGSLRDSTNSSKQIRKILPFMLVFKCNYFSSDIGVFYSSQINGQFVFQYLPKINDYGNYTVIAKHPLDSDTDASNQFNTIYFNILGLSINQSNVDFTGFLDGTYELYLKISNPNYKTINNLKLTYTKNDMLYHLKLIANDSQFESGDLLAALVEPNNELNLKLTLVPMIEFGGQIVVYFSTQEKIRSRLNINVNLTPRTPNIICEPSSFDFRISYGEKKYFQLKVTNVGSLDAKNLKIYQLDAANKHVRIYDKNLSDLNMTDVKMNETKLISFSVSAYSTDREGFYFQTIVISNEYLEFKIPLKYFLTSTYDVKLIVLAQDELTYFAEDKPLLENVTLTLYNPTNNFRQIVVTNSSGIATISNLTENYYEITATAVKHLSVYKFWQPSSNLNYLSLFLQRVTVIVTWTVTPIYYSNRYEISLQSTFETHVYAPVVVVDPMYINLLEFDDGTVDHFMINITNHGLIKANNVDIKLPDQMGNYLFEFDSYFEKFDLNAISSVVVRVNVKRLLKSNPTRKSSEFCWSDIDINFDHECGVTVFGIKQIIIDGGCLSITDPTGPTDPTDSSDGNSGSSITYPPFIGTGETCQPPESCKFSQYDGCDKCVANHLTCVLGFLVNNCVSFGIGATVCSIYEKATCSYHDLIVSLVGCNPKSTLAANTYLCLKGLASGCFDVKFPFKMNRITFQYKEDIFKLMLVAIDGIVTTNDIFLENYNNTVWYSEEASQWLKLNLFPHLSDSSESGRLISLGESAIISNRLLPTNVTLENVAMLIERFNNTEVLHSGGELNAKTTNFINDTRLQELTLNYQKKMAIAASYKFDNFVDWLNDLYKQFPSAPTQENVCAKVTIRLLQYVTITRVGFDAKLEIDNQDEEDLTNLTVRIQITKNGNDKNDLFSIGQPTLDQITSLGENGILKSKQLGTVHWFLIPYREAAPTTDQIYYVGGTLTYVLNDELIKIVLTPEQITVKPDARLEMVYFLQKYVPGDNPLTLDIVEPSTPFPLGLLLFNKGYGSALNFQIVTSQPDIIENEKGLLVDFSIVSAELNNVATKSSLELNLGDVNPFTTNQVIWYMKSSFKGVFSNLSVSFTNQNPNGDVKLSLIDSIQYKELIKLVLVDRPAELSDDLSDFLTIDEYFSYPNKVYVTNINTNVLNVTSLDAFELTNINQAQLNLQSTQTNVFIYLNKWFYSYALIPNTTTLTIRKVTRNDGRLCPLQNFWFSDFNSNFSVLNIFDFVENSALGYATLSYQVELLTPDNSSAPVFDQSTYEFNVAYDITINSRIGKINAYYVDTGSLRYRLVNGTDLIGINDISGVLTLLKLINNSFSIIAVVENIYVTPPLSSNCVVRINYVDIIGDKTPLFDQDAYFINAKTSSPANTLLLKLDAIVHDTQDMNLVFELLSENVYELFSLNNSSGEIRSRKRLINYSNQTFDLLVQADNNGFKSKQIHVIIHVINDERPVFGKSMYCFSVNSSDLKLNQYIGQISAWLNGSTVVYTLNTNLPRSSDFFIDPLNGSVFSNVDKKYQDIYIFNATAINIQDSSQISLAIVEIRLDSKCNFINPTLPSSVIYMLLKLIIEKIINFIYYILEFF